MKILKNIKIFFSIKFIIILFLILIKLFFLFTFIKQDSLYLNYIFNYGYYITFIIYKLNFNKIYKSFYFKIVFFFYFSSLIFYIIKNINFEKKFLKKISYFLIHFSFFFISFFFYIKFVKNIFIKKNIFFSKNFYIWLPNKWSFNKIIYKFNKKFVIFNFPIFLKLNSFNIQYNKKYLVKFFYSNLFFKKKNYNIYLNNPFLYSNIFIYQNSYEYYNSFLKIILYYIKKNKINKIYIKTYLDDIIYLNLFKKKFLLKFSNIKDNYILYIYDVFKKKFFNLDILNFKKKYIKILKNFDNIYIFNYFKEIIKNNFFKIFILNKYYFNKNKNIFILLNSLLFNNINFYNYNFFLNLINIYFNYFFVLCFKNFFLKFYLLIKKNFNKNLNLNNYNLIFFYNFYYLFNEFNLYKNKFYIDCSFFIKKNSSLFLINKKNSNFFIYYLIIIFFIGLILNFLII
ncbi:Cytochrome c-type biogeneis protein Ccs1/ResB [Candidatus Nasuia deltocephalinicola]|nr:Cytochrome c-type biogeneis protein Ccs1/ResB [Candidatus Nasuia deltocephalinicola]